MKKKLTKLLAVILGTSMLCAIPVFAADETNEPRITFQSHDSSTKNFSANNISFQLSTTLYDTDSQYKAGVWIVVPNQQVVPAQTMSATAYLFDGNKNMVRSHSTTQTNDTYFIYTETLKDDSSTPVFYAYGDVTIDYLDGSSTASSRTPILYYNDGILQEYSSMPKSVSDDEPKKTAQGLVYGNIVDNRMSDLDLIAAVGVDGTCGYVRKTDFAPELTTQEAREVHMAALKENNLIPLYDLNGKQIGQFAIDIADDISVETQTLLDQMQMNVPVSTASEATSTQEGQEESLASAISEEVNSRMVNGTYPTTASGETYGTLLDSFVIGYYPDLIAVVGNANLRGYIYYRELSRASAGALVNVYDLNGNVIDYYGQG